MRAVFTAGIARCSGAVAWTAAALALAACGGSGVGYLQGSTAARIGCPARDVTISEHGQTLGNETWLASCHDVLYHCTKIATGYGTALSCNREAAAAPPPAKPTPEVVTAAKAPLVETPATEEVRALLERNRAAITACAGRPVVGVRAESAAGGALLLSLTGELAGSPEEACVRQALTGARLTAVPAGVVVVHVVR